MKQVIKHYLIVNDNFLAAKVLQASLCVRDGDIQFHIVQKVSEIRDRLVAFPADVVITRLKDWNYESFSGIIKKPVLVIMHPHDEKIRDDQPCVSIKYLPQNYGQKEIDALKEQLDNTTEGALTEFIFVKFERRWHRLPVKDIQGIEKRDNNYVVIHTLKGFYQVHGNLTYWMKRLPKDRFTREKDMIIHG